MSGRISLLQGDPTLVPMKEALYDSEATLQTLLAQHPDLLAGEQINSDVSSLRHATGFSLKSMLINLLDHPRALASTA